MSRYVLRFIVSVLFIAMLLFAAVSKWIDFAAYRYEMNSQPFPNELTPFLIWTIPFLQVAAALLLFSERTRSYGFAMATGIVAVFTIYTLAVLLHAFKYIPCECGGMIKGLSWSGHLLFNLFYLIAGLAALFITGKNNSLK